MTRKNIKKFIYSPSIFRVIFFILISLASLPILLSNLVKIGKVDVDYIAEQFENERQLQISNPNLIPKVTEQEDINLHKKIDLKCISWSVNQVNSGWSQNHNSEDTDFFIDYYVPQNKNAIICITPVLGAILMANANKPFLYEAYSTQYGLRIRIVIGASHLRRFCNRLSGNANCANSILVKQATVKYEE